MAILPLQLARVSNTLRTNLAHRTLSRTQQSLVEVQNQLATGKRMTVPSDNPGDAAAAQQLRKTLEQRQAYADNLQYAGSHLSEVDSALGDLTDLLREAQTIASANVGSDVTRDQRTAAATIVDSLYQQAVSLGNRQFRGMYLFGGDRGGGQPFVPEGGGVKFVGSERPLQNSVDESTVLPFMVDGNELFGALSTRVQGSVDLSPRMTVGTRLCDLNGSRGNGVRRGSIQLGNGSVSAVIDLGNADTVGDVIDAVNAAGVGSITASLAPDGNSLLLSGGPTDCIRVRDLSGGWTAADLGILTAAPAAPGVSVDGQSVDPRLTLLTRLSDLRGGAGMDTASGLIISNGMKTVTVSLGSAATVGDLLSAISDSGAGVLARIHGAGNGIDVVSPVQGISMTIGENGGTTAADLGIRSFGPGSPLSELNGGKGVRRVSGADMQIARRDGTSFAVDLSGVQTVQAVIDAINAADGGGGVTASFAGTGNGIVLTDLTGGGGNLAVAALNYSMAASDLGLAGSSSTNVLAGRDVNAVQTSGVFGDLGKLRDGLIGSDQAAITEVAELLRADLERVVRIRGQVGARVNDVESRQQRVEEQNLATTALISSLEDTDYNEAITRFQTLQTVLQANLQTAGSLLNLSLLDFLQ